MFKRTKVCSGLMIAFGGAIALGSFSALAQQQLERVEVTGSSIKRSISSEGALPITILNASELREAGVTTAEQVIQRISSSQTSRSSSQSIGSGTGGQSVANLRGLGSNKTLVLLNGRRVASFAFDSSSVDLNAIPFAVVDRVEILRDGASAIYGTDAIGGVINFITRSNFKGFELAAEKFMPQHKGGGEERQSATAGFGDLDTTGFNIWLAVDRHRQEGVAALDRDFGATGVIPDKGLIKTSATTFPGNFVQGSLSGNTTLAAGCNPPLSLSLPSISTKSCRFDYTAMIDIVPPTEQETVVARGSMKVGEKNLLSLELVSSKNQNIARIASDPVTGITMTPSSPYYPTAFPGIDPTKNITVGWRMIPAGRRTNQANSSLDRVVLDLTGSLAEYDYRAGIFSTTSKAADGATDGYVNATTIKAGVLAGTLNPFGNPTDAQIALIETAKMKGEFANAKGTTRGIDLHVSRDLFALSGGSAAISVGGELRRETYQNDTNDDMVNNVPSAGRSPYHAGGNRNVSALSAEMLLPFTKELEVNLAARYDKYSDSGSTFNPKVGVRFQPFKGFLMRGSVNTGFRAPSLDEIHGPQAVTFTADPYNDPLLCPGGKVDTTKGGVESRDCGQQAQLQTGGNPALTPEKSTTIAFGAAFEPVKGLTLSVDYWNIKLKNQINPFPEQAIFADPAKYAARYVRCNAVSVADQAKYDRCAGEWAGGPGLAYAIALTDNLGGVKTDGLDFSGSYSLLLGSAGTLGLSYDGTWVNSYKYQRTISDPYVENVGIYIDSSPVFRWQHNLGAIWSRGSWSAQLNIRNKSGYIDQTPDNTVKAYTLADASVTAKPIKGLTVTLGVKNMFDTKPPFSNQGTTFQQGYDPRFTDAIGRTYTVRGSYAF